MKTKKVKKVCKYPDCVNYNRKANDYCCSACYSDHLDSARLSKVKPRYNRTQNKIDMHISQTSQVVFNIPKHGGKTLVTDVICIDGKKHRWKDILMSTTSQDTHTHIFCWCEKCGSRTEFTRPRSKPSSKWIRCQNALDETKKEIWIPEIFSDWATVNYNPNVPDPNALCPHCGDDLSKYDCDVDDENNECPNCGEIVDYWQ